MLLRGMACCCMWREVGVLFGTLVQGCTCGLLAACGSCAQSYHVYAVQAATGKVAWTHKTGGAVEASPLVTPAGRLCCPDTLTLATAAHTPHLLL